MSLFNAEGLAEEVLARDDWKLFREFVGDATDVERYVRDLARPGALTAGLNWYRANAPVEIIVSGNWPQIPAVGADTLGVWSSGDIYCGEEQLAGSADFVTGSWRFACIDGADHWMGLSAADAVNGLLVDFLTG